MGLIGTRNEAVPADSEGAPPSRNHHAPDIPWWPHFVIIMFSSLQQLELCMSKGADREKALVFYHTIALGPDLKTEGWPAIVPIVEMVRGSMAEQSFKGKRVLDIGCRDGALAFEAERLGAREVIGVDFDLPRENLAYLCRALKSNVTFEERNLFDIRPNTYGLFDIILFSGVLYHLRYPFYALRLLGELLEQSGLMIVETATFVDDNRLSLLFCPTGEESPYESTSCSFFNTKGFMDTISSLGFAVESHRSLLNLAVNASTKKSPQIDRSVFVCRKQSA